MKKLLIFFFAMIIGMCSQAKVYYTSPIGTETVLNKVTRDNPAEWRWITQHEGSQSLKCGDSVLLRWDQGIYTEGTRIYATGCSDTQEGAIHYLSEPGGFAVFKINKYIVNPGKYSHMDSRHYDRQINPNGIIIGEEIYLKNGTIEGGYNKRYPPNTEKGNYVWLREIAMNGNFTDLTPKRDLGTMDLPYGSTGARDPGTIAGSQNYDDMTGNIFNKAKGSRIINCLFWNLGHSGIGVYSGQREGNSVFYGNIITNTGHSGPTKDRFHSVYQQWQSDNKGRLVHKHNIIQFSAEEQLQIWAQGGVIEVPQSDGSVKYISKVDKVDLIENVLINAGTLSGQGHPKRYAGNAKIGGYTFSEDIRIIGNISYHDFSTGWQNGYEMNFNNDVRNLEFKNNYIVGIKPGIFKNISSIQEVSGNTFVTYGGSQIDFLTRVPEESKLLASTSKWDNNQYYGGGNFTYQTWWHQDLKVKDEKLAFEGNTLKKVYTPGWKDKGFDINSSYTTAFPKDEIRYFANEYLDHYPTNWKGHFVILNWSEKKNVLVNVDFSGLESGQRFRVIDVQNVANDVQTNYVYEGIYTPGMSVEIPMNLTDVVKDPTEEMTGPIHTSSKFFTGLVIGMKGFSRPEPPIDPPIDTTFNGSIDDTILDDHDCVNIITSGEVDKVVIIPVGGQAHTENNAPWTMCPGDLIGVDPQGIILVDVIAYDFDGNSDQKQFTINYEEPVEPPVDPPVIPNDYVTKEHFDAEIAKLKADHLTEFNLLMEEFEKVLNELNDIMQKLNIKKTFKEE